MRVLITGNLGYVGSMLVGHLRRALPRAELIGFDAGWFSGDLTQSGPLPETQLDVQHFGDVRAIPANLLRGCDAVVHLAAISNDPMGNRFAAVTEDINHAASVTLAAAARDAGVGVFVFASSCSVYGAADGAPRREGDALNPQTAYARSKIATEQSLADMDRGGMRAICLRFATACGWSSRLRLDLVLNDFVACALSSAEISILSDGTPWRPLIDVRDMARAIQWAITRHDTLPGHIALNVGSDRGNIQIRNLAMSVAAAVPGTRIQINSDAVPDKRSYQVDFSRFTALAAEFAPQVDLSASIAGLVAGLRAIGFSDRGFRGSALIRLRVLEKLMEIGTVDDRLRAVAA